MNIKKAILSAMRPELSKEKQTILSLIEKHADLVHVLDEEDQSRLAFPYLYIQGDQFSLIYEVPLGNTMDFIFTSSREILFLVRHIFKENMTLRVYIEPNPLLSNDEIWSKIHDAIANDDKAAFIHYSSLLS
jgi:hypothetical protein